MLGNKMSADAILRFTFATPIRYVEKKRAGAVSAARLMTTTEGTAMVKSTVRPRCSSINLLDVLLRQYDEDTMPSIETLEANDLCVTLGGLIVPVGFYEWVCAEMGARE